jgi:proteic killer suppression protein
LAPTAGAPVHARVGGAALGVLGEDHLKARRLSLDVCTVKPYIYGREDLERSASRASAPHRGRRQPGASPDLAKRLRNILGVLIIAEDMTKVIGPPGWRVHQLKGDRAGTWSVSLSGNWRLTFDVVGGDICNLNLEDYH